MKSRIRHVSYVINFLDVGFNSSEISEILESETDKIIYENNLANLTDWEIQFRATYTNAKQILISKNRFGSYRNDKYKEITIPIPIPTNDIISWGVNKDQHIYENNHYDNILNNFYCISVNYFKYNSRAEYILDSLRQVIKFCFENKYSLNGIKLKLTPDEKV